MKKALRHGGTEARRGRWALVLSLVVLPACAPLAYFAQVISPPKVEPVYVPEDRLTLVLVDDPSHYLGGGVLAGVVADRIMLDLTGKDVITRFVSLGELQKLVAKLDRDYPKTPIDQIGRALGAELVLYVKIEGAHLSTDPGLLVPKAAASVKIIDAVAQKRIFPPSGPGATQAGHPVRSSLAERVQMERSPSAEAMLLRKLAGRIGRDVGRLFYTYNPKAPGHMTDD